MIFESSQTSSVQMEVRRKNQSPTLTIYGNLSEYILIVSTNTKRKLEQALWKGMTYEWRPPGK